MAKAAIEIPDDYLAGLRRCADTEKGDLSAFVIQAMLENYEAAKEDRRAMCGDTGVPRWYVKIGNEATIEGGPVALEAALRRATAHATTKVPLRPNRVHPLWRTDHNNNVGIGAPEIEYSFHPDADWIDLTTVHKGGLFGSDYRMLFPGDGIDGIKRFYLDTLIGFGKRGLACQPAIVGVGLGGSKDISMVLGKQASCLRVVGSRNPDPKIAALEDEFKELGNTIGMGAMGFMGSSMVVDCHIEVGYCHTGGMPMSVHMFCLSSRRATARIFADGQAQFRTDPMWFTDYMRRSTVEWEQPAAVGGGVDNGRPQDSSSQSPRARRRSAQAWRSARSPISLAASSPRAKGVYKRAIEDGAGMPAGRDALGLVNFHCSPAASVNPDGSHTVGAVTATASFRFAKWLDGWFQLSGCNIIIGKGGMTSEIYRNSFVPNQAIYLTTVGYGTGALLGRGIKRVAGVYWLEELGFAQAVWVLDVEKFGPFLVESDLAGNSLFERENAKIAPGLEKLYAGTKPATLRRYGETDDKTEEVI